MSGLLDRILSWLVPVHASVSNTTMKNGTAEFSRQGSIVTLTSTGDIKSLTRGSWVTYVTIPVGYRPANNTYVTVLGRDGYGTSYIIFCLATADGKLQFYLNGNTNITSAQNCRLTAVWSTV